MYDNYQIVDNRETRRKKPHRRYNGCNRIKDFAKEVRKRRIAKESRKKNRGRWGMKKIEIYFKEELILSTLVEDYQIDTYTNTIEFHSKIKEIEITYSIPVNKEYRIVADI